MKLIWFNPPDVCLSKQGGGEYPRQREQPTSPGYWNSLKDLNLDISNTFSNNVQCSSIYLSISKTIWKEQGLSRANVFVFEVFDDKCYESSFWLPYTDNLLENIFVNHYNNTQVKKN